MPPPPDRSRRPHSPDTSCRPSAAFARRRLADDWHAYQHDVAHTARSSAWFNPWT